MSHFLETLSPPAPASEAQSLRARASELRLQAARLERTARDLEAAAAGLERRGPRSRPLTPEERILQEALMTKY